MFKIFIGSLLALTAANSVADNVFIYEDDNQQALTASNNKVEDEDNIFIYENSNQSGSFDKFNKKVKITYYVDKSKGRESKQKQTESHSQNYSYGTSSSSASYANPAFAALR